MEIFDRPQLSHDTYFDTPQLGRNTYRSWESDIALRETLTKLWARKRFILLSILICAVLSFLLTKVMTRTYTGEAQLAIKPPQAGLLVGDQNVPVATQVDPDRVMTETYTLRSRALADATVVRLQLDRDPEFDPSLRKPGLLATLLSPAHELLNDVQGWLQPGFQLLLGGTNPDAVSDEPEAETDQSAETNKSKSAIVSALLNQLFVTVQPRSSVIWVSFKSSRAATAAAVPNTIIQLYLEQQTKAKDQALVQEREQLDNVILPAFREKMEASETKLAEYRQKSGLLTDRNATALGQELSEARAQLAMARTRSAEAALRVKDAEPTSKSPGEASEPAAVQQLKVQEIALQEQLSALKRSHGPNYPQTMQLETQLQELREGIRREKSEASGRLKTELSGAQATEAALTKRVTELTRQYALVNGGDAQLQNLLGQADADRKANERYLARSNELLSSIGHAQPDAILLSPADPPGKSSPNAKLIVLMGTLTGAAVGLIWVALLDGLLRGLRNERQVEEILGIKCVGLIPKVRRNPGYSLRRRERLSAIRDFTLDAQYAEFGEAIRSAHMRLLSFSRPTEPCVILVTAALPNEGKSWVAASLALSLAADGSSVALVDCDVNRPMVHRMFDGPRGPGLTDCFAERVTLDEIVHTEPATGLCYIPIGSAVARDTWRRTFGLIRPLVDRLREKYAFVILDSAPVLAISDTILLSQIAQKTILVVKWASTPPAVARRAAIQLLDSAGAEMVGLLSMVNTKHLAKNGDPIAGAYRELQSYYGR
jgi:uncharacterized protein involved in exopolysaccharide biosynthesis/Mrp family chromosome partitioning ATPase